MTFNQKQNLNAAALGCKTEYSLLWLCRCFLAHVGHRFPGMEHLLKMAKCFIVIV